MARDSEADSDEATATGAGEEKDASCCKLPLLLLLLLLLLLFEDGRNSSRDVGDASRSAFSKMVAAQRRHSRVDSAACTSSPTVTTDCTGTGEEAVDVTVAAAVVTGSRELCAIRVGDGANHS